MKRLRWIAVAAVLFWSVSVTVGAVIAWRLSEPDAPTTLIVPAPGAEPADLAPHTDTGDDAGGDPLRLDVDGNGRLSCVEVAPRVIERTDPEYRYMDDGDNDGFVCER